MIPIKIFNQLHVLAVGYNNILPAKIGYLLNAGLKLPSILILSIK